MIETNAKDIYSRFIELSTKEMRKSLTAGMRGAMRTVRNDARSNLRASVKGVSRKNPKFSDTLLSGVRNGKVKEGKDGEITGSVLITSTRKSGSGSFRLKIIEKGTFRTGVRFVHSWRGRRLKKAARRGSIRATNFFAKTRNSKESYFNMEMVRAMDKAIDKINKSK